MSKIYRETYAEINLKDLYNNYVSIDKILKNKKIIPVVKANAYGHGVIDVVSYLVSKEIDYFAVSTLEEAMEIKEEFENVDILVMGVVQSEYFNESAEKNITITICNNTQLEGLLSLKRTIKVHIKVDSGMNRLGFKTDAEIQNAFDILMQNKHVIIEGIYSHFSTADSDIEYYNIQLNRFKYVLDKLNYNFEMIHVSNSSSAIKYEKELTFTSHARIGISLYGLTLDDETKFLRNTYKLISHISQIKELEIGDKVGYGTTYVAKQRETIGILPIGYADGFIRRNRDSQVEINNKLYPIIGTICMDQMFIKIDDSVTEDDDVILFGNLVSIDEVAARLDTINYEVICQISYRVPKKYLK